MAGRSKATKKPTEETYTELQYAYDVFNQNLFGGQLPYCLITLQREKHTMGYFSPARFGSVDGKVTDEIALNPNFFGSMPLVEIFQTLVHEMCHLWQHHFGQPGRGRYHNKEWADKMESVGLIPSSTGKPGGKKTGDHMSDYPSETGYFWKVCQMLVDSGFNKVSWVDRSPSERSLINGQGVAIRNINLGLVGGAAAILNEVLIKPTTLNESIASEVDMVNINIDVKAPVASKIKYTCPCKNNVWGRPKLKLICGECQQPYQEQ